MKLHRTLDVEDVEKLKKEAKTEEEESLLQRKLFKMILSKDLKQWHLERKI